MRRMLLQQAVGISIHYELGLAAGDAARARQVVENAARIASELGFADVGEVLHLTGAACDPEAEASDRDLSWLLIQSMRRDETGKPIANAEEMFAVSTSPGKGSEAANIGLARYAGVAGWSWRSFCKTHYAGAKEAGGVANFVRCHAGVCMLLASIKKLGVKVEVADEMGFWEHRDHKRLAADRKMRLF